MMARFFIRPDSNQWALFDGRHHMGVFVHLDDAKQSAQSRGAHGDEIEIYDGSKLHYITVQKVIELKWTTTN